MLIATNGRFTIVSTPFGKRGLFWEQYKFAVDQKDVNPNVHAYDLFPSTISPLISKEDMERERLNLTGLEFQQEYEGQFIEEVDTYLPLALIEQCVDPALTLIETGEPGKQYYVGVDFAKQRDESVVVLLERATDSILIVRHIATWTQIDYSDQVGRIGQLAKKFPIISGRADQTGVGEVVMEDVRKVAPNIQGVIFTAQTKVELATGLRTLLEQKQLLLPDEKKLKLQLNSLRYQVGKTGNLLFESPDKERIHDDYLWALALACYAARLGGTPEGLFALRGAARRQ
jgi:phage FluMu gp28-like protein